MRLGKLRIVSGTLGGRQISGLPKDPRLRPTLEKVREAVFSILTSLKSFDETIVLDLYSGSGSLGIEAISRGARFCVFVEHNKQFAKILADNIEKLGIADKTKIILGDATNNECFKKVHGVLANTVDAQSGGFDFVFIDPPYGNHPGVSILPRLKANQLVDANTICVLESDKPLSVDGLDSVELFKERKYGQTWTYYYKFIFGCFAFLLIGL